MSTAHLRKVLASAVLVALVASACDDGGSSITTGPAVPPTADGPSLVRAAPAVALHQEGTDEIGTAVLSDNGEVVVFTARNGSVWTVYAASVTGGPAAVLHEGLAGIGALGIAPDSSRVVYTAFEQGGTQRLVSTAFDGSLPVNLTDGLGLVEGFQPFMVTPDSQRVVYRYLDFETELESLRVVPIGGGTHAELAGAPAPGHVGYSAAAPGFRVTPDSRRVVYLADPDGDFLDDLYVAPITGGSTVLLNDPPAGDDRGIASFDLAAGGSQVVLAGQVLDPELFELFSVDLDTPGELTKLSPELPAGASVVSYDLDPTGDRVLFAIGVDAAQAAGLFSVPVAGGDSVALAARPSGALPSTFVVGRYEASPDGTRVAADTLTGGAEVVISTPIDGGEVLQLSPDDSTARLVGFSEDSQTIVYLLDNALVTVATAGGAVRRLTGAFPVLQARAIGEGGLVVFTAGETVATQGLFGVPPEGGDVVVISEPDTGPEWPVAVAVAPGGQHLVYLTGTVTAEAGTTTGVYVVPLG